MGTGWSGRYATYNPSDDWKKIPFNDFYSKFYPDYFNLKNQSDDELFLSLAELYRIVVMLRVTDTYGPIPYSKVGAANAIKSPYDSQQAVYAKMLEDLATKASAQVLIEFIMAIHQHGISLPTL